MARRTKPDPLASKIGARVRALRKELGLTLEQLAYSCDFSKGQLSTIEKGLAVPTAATLAVLAEGLEALPLDLLTFPEDSPREKLIDVTRGLSKKELEAVVATVRRRSETAR
jgi:transcriptional regulator with XRE-family HTH domain